MAENSENLSVPLYGKPSVAGKPASQPAKQPASQIACHPAFQLYRTVEIRSQFWLTDVSYSMLRFKALSRYRHC